MDLDASLFNNKEDNYYKRSHHWLHRQSGGRFREDEVRRLTPDVIPVDTDLNEFKIEEFCMNFQEEEDDNSDKKRGIVNQEEDDN